jgi:hypothetical protein
MLRVILSVSLSVSAKIPGRRIAMSKAFTFTTKSYPTNDLFALDLQSHMDQMAKLGWDLVSTQHLIEEDNSKIPQMMFFWSKNE